MGSSGDVGHIIRRALLLVRRITLTSAANPANAAAIPAIDQVTRSGVAQGRRRPARKP